MKCFLLLMLFSFTASAQDVPRTRIVTYEITDSVWTLKRDTVIDGNYWRRDYMDMRIMRYGFKSKTLNKRGANVQVRYEVSPYLDEHDAIYPKGVSHLYELKLAYFPQATLLKICKEGSVGKDEVLKELQLKQFSYE